MPETDWRRVAGRLRAFAGGPTPAQAQLADTIGLPLAGSTPEPVATTMLRAHLQAPLDLPLPGDVTDQQREYLTEIAAEVGLDLPDDIFDRDLLDARVAVAHALRAALRLEELQPEVGDIVSHWTSGFEQTGEVASISADGRINFKGGGGAGTRPHRASIVARMNAGEEYQTARYRAEQEAVARVANPETRVLTRTAELKQWKVSTEPSLAAVLALRDALAEADSEAPMQEVLERYPEILGYLINGHHGLWVIPRPRLAGQYVPDFLVAGETSAGIRWTLVELESPTARLAIKAGSASETLRTAMKQVTYWREWLKDNLDFARKSRNDNGLELPGIRDDARALIILGRGDLADDIDRLRNRIRTEQQIEVRTYDWLIRAAHTSRGLPIGVLDVEVEDGDPDGGW